MSEKVATAPIQKIPVPQNAPYNFPLGGANADPDMQGSPGLKQGDPPFNIARLRRWAEDPTGPELERLAIEFLERCGDSVLVDTSNDADGVPQNIGILYTVEKSSGTNENGKPWSKKKIRGIPREFLGLKRQQIATGIDLLRIEADPNT